MSQFVLADTGAGSFSTHLGGQLAASACAIRHIQDFTHVSKYYP
ncbi:hypothetical protein [Rhodococcus qingshengii]|nr:hypothetical protein [Rhodococcus qingshengii]